MHRCVVLVTTPLTHSTSPSLRRRTGWIELENIVQSCGGIEARILLYLFYKRCCCRKVNQHTHTHTAKHTSAHIHLHATSAFCDGPSTFDAILIIFCTPLPPCACICMCVLVCVCVCVRCVWDGFVLLFSKQPCWKAKLVKRLCLKCVCVYVYTCV